MILAVQFRTRVESPSSFVLSDALIVPATLVVATGSIHATCVVVRSSTFQVPAVVRPFIVLVATVACFAFVTTLLSIVHTVPLDVSFISPLSQSVRVGIDKSPLPSTVTQFIVLMFVHDTSVSCLPAMSGASSLSALRFSKLELIFGSDTPVMNSDDIISCIVLIL